MKNKLVITALSVLALTVSSQAFAQSIETGTLGAAQDYDVGVMDFGSGGLDPALWQGTSAKIAKTLLERAKVKSENPILETMVKTVILSAGVPPEGADDSYARARLRAIMALDNPAALDAVARRSPELAADPVVRADLALASGEIAEACTMADSVTEGRGLPQWARLRAFCHVIRDEIPAAELTANLLKKSGYDDALFFGLLNRLTGISKKELPDDLRADPLYVVMAEHYISQQENEVETPLTSRSAASLAKDTEAPKEVRLKAVFKAASRLSDDELEAVMNGLIYDGVEVDALDSASNFDVEMALEDKSALGFAQLFALSKRGSVEALVGLLSRAKEAGVMTRFGEAMSNEMALMPDTEKVQYGLSVFANLAVKQDDIIALQGLFGAMEEGYNRSRIAFAADAIGNGFRLGNLGKDIQSNLGEEGLEGRRAVRDALLALALGSTLTDDEALSLEGAKVTTGRAVDAGRLATLRAAAKAGSRAETTLRAAEILEGTRLKASAFAHVVESLMVAQLDDFAGQIAAQDFLKGLE